MFDETSDPPGGPLPVDRAPLPPHVALVVGPRRPPLWRLLFPVGAVYDFVLNHMIAWQTAKLLAARGVEVVLLAGEDECALIAATNRSDALLTVRLEINTGRGTHQGPWTEGTHYQGSNDGRSLVMNLLRAFRGPHLHKRRWFRADSLRLEHHGDHALFLSLTAMPSVVLRSSRFGGFGRLCGLSFLLDAMDGTTPHSVAQGIVNYLYQQGALDPRWAHQTRPVRGIFP